MVFKTKPLYSLTGALVGTTQTFTYNVYKTVSKIIPFDEGKNFIIDYSLPGKTSRACGRIKKNTSQTLLYNIKGECVNAPATLKNKLSFKTKTIYKPRYSGFISQYAKRNVILRKWKKQKKLPTSPKGLQLPFGSSVLKFHSKKNSKPEIKIPNSFLDSFTSNISAFIAELKEIPGETIMEKFKINAPTLSMDFIALLNALINLPTSDAYTNYTHPCLTTIYGEGVALTSNEHSKNKIFPEHLQPEEGKEYIKRCDKTILKDYYPDSNMHKNDHYCDFYTPEGEFKKIYKNVHIDKVPSTFKNKMKRTLGLVAIGSATARLIYTIGRILISATIEFKIESALEIVRECITSNEEFGINMMSDLVSNIFDRKIPNADTFDIISAILPIISLALCAGLGMADCKTLSSKITNYGKTSTIINSLFRDNTSQLMPLLRTFFSDSFSIYNEEGKELIKLSNEHQSTPLVDYYLDTYKQRELKLLIGSITKFLTRPPVKDPSVSASLRTISVTLSQSLGSLNSKMLTLNQLNSDETRVEPLCILLRGPQNVGKTVVTKYIQNKIAEELHISNKSYNLKKNNEHYDTYRGEMFAYSDEFLADPKDPLVTSLNAIISPARYNLAGADLPDKKQYVNFKLITLCSNFTKENINLNTLINPGSQDAFWGRMQMYDVTDITVQNTGRNTDESMKHRDLPSDFSNLRFGRFQKKTKGFEYVGEEPMGGFTVDHLIKFIITEIVNREWKLLQHQERSLCTLQYQEMVEKFIDKRSRFIVTYKHPYTGEYPIDNMSLRTAFEEYKRESYLNYVPQSYLTDHGMTSRNPKKQLKIPNTRPTIQPLVIRFEGKPNTGKTTCLESFASDFAGFYETEIEYLTINDIINTKPTDIINPKVYVLDDILVTQDHRRSYVTWFNQIHSQPHIIFIITNSICYRDNTWTSYLSRHKYWHMKLEDQADEALVRRLGLVGDIQTNYGEQNIPMGNSMPFHFNGCQTAKYHNGQDIPISRIPLKIFEMYKEFRARAGQILIVKQEPNHPPQYDMKIRAPSYDSLVRTLRSLPAIMYAINNGSSIDTNLVRIQFKDIKLFQQFDRASFNRLQLPMVTSDGDYPIIARKVAEHFFRTYPGKTYCLELTDARFYCMNNIVYMPDIESDIRLFKHENGLYTFTKTLPIEVPQMTKEQIVTMIKNKSSIYIDLYNLARLRTFIIRSHEFPEILFELLREDYVNSSIDYLKYLKVLGIFSAIVGMFGILYGVYNFCKKFFTKEKEANTFEARKLKKEQHRHAQQILASGKTKMQILNELDQYAGGEEDSPYYEAMKYMNSTAEDEEKIQIPIPTKDSYAKVTAEQLMEVINEETVISEKGEMRLKKLDPPAFMDDEQHTILKSKYKQHPKKYIAHEHLCQKCNQRYTHHHSIEKIVAEKAKYCSKCLKIENAVNNTVAMANVTSDPRSQLFKKIIENTVQFGVMCQGIILYDRIGITVAHLFENGLKHACSWDEGITHRTSSVKLLHIDYAADLAVFELEDKTVPAFPNLLKRIRITKYDSQTTLPTTYMRTGKIPVMVDGLSYKVNDSPIYVQKTSVKSPHYEFTNRQYNHVLDYVARGDCGFLLTAVDREGAHILGMHCCFNSSTATFVSLTEYLDILENPYKHQNSNEQEIEIYDDYLAESVRVDSTMFKIIGELTPSPLTGTNCSIMGFNQRLVAPVRDINRQRECGFKIATPDLYFQDDHLPSAISMKNVTDTTNLYNYELNGKQIYDIGWTNIRKVTELSKTSINNFSLVSAIYVDSVMHRYEKSVPLKDSEVINGYYRLTDIRNGSILGINMNSSPGFLSRQKFNITQKKSFFKENEKVLGFYEFKDTVASNWLKSRVNSADQELEIRCFPFDVEYHLKRELRPKHKVNKGNTRLFALLGIDGCFLGKRHIGPLISQAYLNRSQGNSQIGCDPIKEFRKRVEKLKQLPDDTYIKVSLDFENFDKRVNEDVFKILSKGFSKVTQRSEKWWNNYFKSTRSGYSIYHGNVFRILATIISGETATTLLGDEANEIGMITVFVARCLELNIPSYEITYEFYKKCVPFLMTYGDDNFAVYLKDFISDVPTVLRLYKENIGYVATLANKGTNVEMTIEDRYFMSRNLNWENIPYLPGLKKSSIIRILNWVPDISRREWIANNLRVALYEASFHDEEFYNHILSDVHKTIKYYQIPRDLIMPINYLQAKKFAIACVLGLAEFSNSADVLLQSEITDYSEPKIPNSKPVKTSHKNNKYMSKSMCDLFQWFTMEETSDEYKCVPDGSLAIMYYKELMDRKEFEGANLCETAHQNDGLWQVSLDWKFKEQHYEAFGTATKKQVARGQAYHDLCVDIVNHNTVEPTTKTHDKITTPELIALRMSYLEDMPPFKIDSTTRIGTGDWTCNYHLAGFNCHSTSPRKDDAVRKAYYDYFELLIKHSKAKEETGCKDFELYDPIYWMFELAMEGYPMFRLVNTMKNFISLDNKLALFNEVFEEFLSRKVSSEDEAWELIKHESMHIPVLEILDIIRPTYMQKSKPGKTPNMDSTKLMANPGDAVHPSQDGGAPPSMAAQPSDRPMAPLGVGGSAVDRPVDPQTTANILMESQRPGIIQTTGPSMMGYFNVNTRDLVDHAYQPMDSLQTVAITGSDAPGKIILKIPYGPNQYLSRPARKWLSLHKYFEGSFHYTIHQAAVPLIKGELIWGYMTRTPKDDEIIGIDELQKIDWNTDNITGTNIFSFNLYDKRREKFYRAVSDFPGDADFQADLPCIVGVVHISPENQFPEGSTTITIRIRSCLGATGTSPMPFKSFDLDFATLTTPDNPINPVTPIPMTILTNMSSGYLGVDGTVSYSGLNLPVDFNFPPNIKMDIYMKDPDSGSGEVWNFDRLAFNQLTYFQHTFTTNSRLQMNYPASPFQQQTGLNVRNIFGQFVHWTSNPNMENLDIKQYFGDRYPNDEYLACNYYNPQEKYIKTETWGPAKAFIDGEGIFHPRRGSEHPEGVVAIYEEYGIAIPIQDKLTTTKFDFNDSEISAFQGETLMRAYSIHVYKNSIEFFAFIGGFISITNKTKTFEIPEQTIYVKNAQTAPISMPQLIPSLTLTGLRTFETIKNLGLRLVVYPDSFPNVTSYNSNRWTVPQIATTTNTLTALAVQLGYTIGDQREMSFTITTPGSSELIGFVRYNPMNGFMYIKGLSFSSPYYVCNYAIEDLVASGFRLVPATQPPESTNINYFTPRFTMNMNNPIKVIRTEQQPTMMNSRQRKIPNAAGFFGGAMQGMGGAMQQHQQYMYQDAMNTKMYEHLMQMSKNQFGHEKDLANIMNTFRAQESMFSREQQKTMAQQQHAQNMSARNGMVRANNFQGMSSNPSKTSPGPKANSFSFGIQTDPQMKTTMSQTNTKGNPSNSFLYPKGNTFTPLATSTQC